MYFTSFSWLYAVIDVPTYIICIIIDLCLIAYLFTWLLSLEALLLIGLNVKTVNCFPLVRSPLVFPKETNNLKEHNSDTKSTLYWDIGWHSVFLASCIETFSHALPTPSLLSSFPRFPICHTVKKRQKHSDSAHSWFNQLFPHLKRLVCLRVSAIVRVASCAIGKRRVALMHLGPDVLLLSVERCCTADRSREM